MGFDVNLVITGVCGLVPRRNPPRQPGALCVILPNAWWDEDSYSPESQPVRDRSLSYDNVSKLVRHKAFMRFDVQYLKGSSLSARLMGIFEFAGHRLLVQPHFECADQKSGVTLGDVKGLAMHGDVAGRHSKKLCRAANAVLRPDPEVVIGHVIIGHGELNAPATNAQFAFDNYISRDQPSLKGLNSEPSVSLVGLKSLTLIARNFNTDQEVARFEFDRAPRDKSLEIRIANLCEVNPLQWPTKVPVESLKDDEDFRWHYEIMDRREDIKNQLSGLPFPIPRIIPDPANGNGLNCMPKLFPSVKFRLKGW